MGIITESDVFRALVQLLGLAEKGARVAFEVAEDQDLLDAVRSRLAGRSERSHATWHDPKGKRWDVVMRVRGRAGA